jgi:hypothetical protein
MSRNPGAVISLCDLTGVMVKPWADAGYQCWCVDLQHSIRKQRTEGNINYIWGDVRTWTPPPGLDIAFVAAFPPCTDIAVSGARDFVTKGLAKLCDSLELFNACLHAAEWSGSPYMIENPVGVLSSHIRKPDYYFDPCDYGDPWKKRTGLWTGGGFVMPETTPVEPLEGSWVLDMSPSLGRANARSATPPGFAQAVFNANGGIDEDI